MQKYLLPAAVVFMRSGALIDGNLLTFKRRLDQNTIRP